MCAKLGEERMSPHRSGQPRRKRAGAKARGLAPVREHTASGCAGLAAGDPEQPDRVPRARRAGSAEAQKRSILEVNGMCCLTGKGAGVAHAAKTGASATSEALAFFTSGIPRDQG